jgi:hypothetical protein
MSLNKRKVRIWESQPIQERTLGVWDKVCLESKPQTSAYKVGYILNVMKF